MNNGRTHREGTSLEEASMKGTYPTWQEVLNYVREIIFSADLPELTSSDSPEEGARRMRAKCLWYIAQTAVIFERCGAVPNKEE